MKMLTEEQKAILPENMLGLLQTVGHYKRGGMTIQGTDAEAITARGLDRALHELADALLAHKEAREVLRSIQWIENSEYSIWFCPKCHSEESKGHDDDCKLAKNLPPEVE